MDQSSPFTSRIARSPEHSVTPRSGDPDELIDVLAILRAIWRNLWLLILPTVMFAGLGVYYAFYMATPYYRATASVVLETRDAAIVDLQSVTTDIEQYDEVAVSTEIAIIQSERVLSAVVEEMGLLDDPEFNPYVDTDMSVLSEEDQQFINERTQPETIAALQGAIDVQQIHGTYIFSLSALTTDPYKSSEIANSLADVYLRQQLSQKVDANRQASEWLIRRLEELQDQLITAEAKIETFRFNEATQDQFEDAVALERLTREAQAIREVYQHFLTRLKETAAQEGLHTADASILSYAVTPIDAAAPRKKLILAAATVLGGIVGLALIALREVMRPGMRSPKALELAAPLPVLGATPKLTFNAKKDISVAINDPRNGLYISAIENVRTNLLLSPEGSSIQTLGITSSTLNESKTTMSISLSSALAAANAKVLVIDTDLRRRKLSQMLYPSAEHGVIYATESHSHLGSVAVTMPGLGFDLLACEMAHERPVDLLQSAEFQQLVAMARDRYDYVVFDTPPVLAVPDARALAPVLDQMVVLAKYGRTSAAMVQESIASLETSHVKIAGTVMTQVPASVLQKTKYGVGIYTYGSVSFDPSGTETQQSAAQQGRVDNAGSHFKTQRM